MYTAVAREDFARQEAELKRTPSIKHWLIQTFTLTNFVYNSVENKGPPTTYKGALVY